MAVEKMIFYKDLENLYTACISSAIKTALESAWANEEGGPFARFKVSDANNVERANKNKKDGPKVNGITANCHDFDSFDFQACNKTLFYLGDVYKEIYAFYNMPSEISKMITTLAGKMLSGRNILAHLKPNTDAEKIEQVQNELLEYINSVFAIGFNNITDKNGITYAELFKKGYHAYQTQQMFTWARLDDYLDRNKYDFSIFPDICISNNIKTKMEDGCYWFYSSDVPATVAILKNNLSYKNARKKEQKTLPAKNPLLSFFPFLIIGIIIIAIIIFAVVFSSLPSILEDNPMPTATNQTTQNTPADQPSDNTDVKNQILPEHQNEINALKYSSDLDLSTRTVTVKEGSLVSLPCSLAWKNIKIYSEDTTIAVGEGTLVKGVSKGTTYIIAQSKTGTTTSYCIIVE